MAETPYTPMDQDNSIVQDLLALEQKYGVANFVHYAEQHIAYLRRHPVLSKEIVEVYFLPQRTIDRLLEQQTRYRRERQD